MKENNDFKGLIDSMRGKEMEPIFLTFGIQSLYTEENLNAIEQVINRLFPEEREVLPTTVIPFGYMLGETLVRNIPDAKWKTDVDEIWDIAVEIPIKKENTDANNMVILPFVRADKFFKDRTDSLAVMYRMANMMSLQFLDPLMEKAEYGEWVNLKNGDSFRKLDPEGFKDKK
jgi:hypothetical protein